MKTTALDRWVEVYGQEGMSNEVWEAISRWEEDQEWAMMALDALSVIAEGLPAYHLNVGRSDTPAVGTDDWDIHAKSYWSILVALAQIQQELKRLRGVEKANKRLMKKVEKLSQLSLF
jgi:hypothetical protein